MSLTEVSTFNELRSRIQQNFATFNKLYYVEIDREEIWNKYLSGFDESVRQENNCNCCKAFLRQFGGIVTIKDGEIVSLWDNLDISGEFQQSVENLRDYIHSRPITDIFLSATKKIGTEKNLDGKRNIFWEHFYLQLPNAVICSNDSIPTKLGSARDDKNVLQRSLEEITIDATETVLELIDQNSLYRGKEFEGLLRGFLTIQKQYQKSTVKDLYCWEKSAELGPGMCRIRNTSIGTLLTDLSNGLALDDAVRKFEKVVAPTNYKRPVALVTPKMVEQAKETLTSLGLLESLNRRYANEADLHILDILFTDKAATLTDVFHEVAKESVVNPRSFSKTEEIGIEEFLTNVVPTAKSISVLVENQHLNNFVSLITAQDKETPTLLKWNNHFSWSYTGNVTDSIKERVKQAGGNVTGELRASLSWSNYDDLDIHVIEPNKNTIFYANKRSPTSGHLDVDMNAGSGTTRSPVENIIWTNKATMAPGKYQVRVNNYCSREATGQGFDVQIECNGEIFDFGFSNNPKGFQDICTFQYSKNTGITFDSATKSNVLSKEKWGIKTNQFHKVTNILLSPNHWGANIGNKHYLFMLDQCISDETPRPFYNEFLKPELEVHRKVLEILGSKVKIEDSPNQLSGVGFSQTQKSSVIVKVTGKFTRTLKVTF